MTATNATRKRRGLKTQDLVAQWLAARGWPYAESAGSGRTGSDITGVPGLAIEVKGRRGFQPLAWIRQATAAAKPGALPFVVFRCDGQGPASVAQWPVLIRLAEFTELLQAAGYGSSPADCSHDNACRLPGHPPVPHHADGLDVFGTKAENDAAVDPWDESGSPFDERPCF